MPEDKKPTSKDRIEPLHDKGKFNEEIHRGDRGNNIEKGQQRNYSDIGGSTNKTPTVREDITDSTGPMRKGDEKE